MGLFLILTEVGVYWPALYPLSYAVKTVLVAALLAYFLPSYTRIGWHHWWAGLLLGIVGIFQWVPMQHWLQQHFSLFRPDPAMVFDPSAAFVSPIAFWAFVAVRLTGAVLLVPVMEELFWRDFAWRTIVAPNNFKLADIGARDWRAFVIVPLIFACVHGHQAATAVVWGLMIGALLLATRSLGACIVMHATTNLLLGIHVLRYKEWSLW